jgi:sterol desaturase/sphingolipid hydroxylase (fatty acid hydroxylase superfamily)
VPFFVLALIGEIVFARRAARAWFEARDTAASVAMGVGSLVFGGIGAGALLALHVWLYQHRLLPIGTEFYWIPLCFLLQDLAFYWKHRFQHERRWLWAEHVTHHSSERYNLGTAVRQSWTGIISFNWIFYLPISWLGFHPAMTFFCVGVNLLYQFWIHTQSIDRLPRWFELLFNTPSNHRVHHAVNPRYLDANYAGTLMIWDRIFGTYVEERDDDPPRYGILKNITSFNPFVIAFHEWWAILKDLRRARSLREVALYTFGPPGWSPDGSRETSAMVRARFAQSAENIEGYRARATP